MKYKPDIVGVRTRRILLLHPWNE